MANALNLDFSTSFWLEHHKELSDNIWNWLSNVTSTLSVDKIQEIAKQHIQQLIKDPEYLEFVNIYNFNNDGMWWDNNVWLDNPNNFNFDIDHHQGQEYDHLTVAEKALIVEFPIQAYIEKENVTTAVDKSQEIMGDGDYQGLNDKKDAFRHSFFNAINTRDVPPSIFPPLLPSTIVRAFGIAHESETPPQLILEKQMDLHNNDIGIDYCWDCIPGATPNSTIAYDLHTFLTNGAMYYLKPIDLLGLNYWGANGENDPKTAIHGITSSTSLTPTNL